MKYIKFIYIFLMVGSVASAGTGDYVQKNKCYPGFPFQCFVDQKIDKNVEGMVCLGAGLSKHAILQTKDGHLFRGGPLAIGMQFLGTKAMKMDSGFDENVDFWKECDLK